MSDEELDPGQGRLMSDIAERFQKYRAEHSKKCGKIDWGPCQYCRDMNAAAKMAERIEELQAEIECLRRESEGKADE